jgi:inhibitor of cysteine peptidase
MISGEGAEVQKVVEARAGEKTTVVLEENPTTGFVWTLESVDAAIVSLEGSDFIPAAGGGLGAGGQRVFTFLPRQPGVVTLNFFLARPWEDENVHPQEKINITMKIR